MVQWFVLPSLLLFHNVVTDYKQNHFYITLIYESNHNAKTNGPPEGVGGGG